MKILKNKIIITFILLFILLFSNIITVLATDYTYNDDNTVTFSDRNGQERTLPLFNIDGYDISNGFALKYYFGTYYLYILADENSYFAFSGSSDFHIDKGSCYYFQLKNNEWSYLEEIVAPVIRIAVYSEIIYHSVDVYDCDDYSTIIAEGSPNFFQVAPPEEVPETPEEIPETLTTTIPALETVEQIPTAMVETLKLIIPVGLVIFGIVLLILLIKSVISRMT